MRHILGYSAGNGPRRVHVGVDQPRQQGMADRIHRLPRRELLRQFGACTRGNNLRPAHGYGPVGNIAHALPLHGEEMGVRNKDIY